ncbi:hypothetical protein [Desulfonatronovibrio magnus]|uniref:hypothetical protein n=1 Tax=Desulfonatronovibrio magnus TaxID=698827 RepID=UPI0005EB5E83|nr:hypothetical protein [Desulfonatronovibrio magnus]
MIALGLNPAKDDPTGSCSLKGVDFQHNGALSASLALPTLVVQEGDYRVGSLGGNARHYFEGLAGGS